MAIHIRLLQDDEVELANNFFNAVYQTNRPIKNFEWEFLNGPFGKAIYVVAIDEAVSTHTKIVGIQCAIPLEFISTKGQTILTAKSEDTLVDPSYRGQKIFERMYAVLFEECEKAGVKYIWGFTPAQKAFERIGFEIPFKTEQALLVFKPIEAYQYLQALNEKNTLIDKIKIFGLSTVSWLSGVWSRFKKQGEIIEAGLENKSDLFKNFYNDATYFTLNESTAYIKWRITNNPFHNNYKSYQYKIGSEVVADAILNIRDNVSYIEQLLSKQGIDLVPFITTLSTVCAATQVPLLRAFCFSSNKINKSQGYHLSLAGFRYLKRGNYFVWKSLDADKVIQPNQLIINRLFTQGNL